jgi:hypothetical protein
MAKTYTAVPDKASGDLFTETMWDTSIRQNINNLIAPAMAKVTHASNADHAAFSDATLYAQPWTVEVFDSDGMVSLGSNATRITFQTAGVYHLCGYAPFVTNSADVLTYCALRISGTTYIASARNAPAVLAQPNELVVTALYEASASQYVELIVYSDSSIGANGQLSDNAGSQGSLSAVWVGRETA